ncbi:MAG: pilus assembly protein PilM [Deltaproteobacteria bacterium]|nr:pilus assembly protein PilM [Deltaproteobacteria bacterium]MBI3389953.1 pilus assembly protein PilM [Deltaproteobacteria bacterium]
MPQRILALDVEETEVKAAVLETSFRDYRIAGLYHEALTPDGGATGEQVRRFLDRHQLAGETVVSTLPGGLVSHRVFFLPFRDRKRLNQTIPFELETQVPFGLDEVIVDYSVLHRDRSGTTVLAAMVQKTDLEAHLAMLRSAGIDPKVVDLASMSGLNVLRVLSADLPATFAFVECNANSVHVALYRNQQLVGLRTLAVGHGAPATNGAANGHALAEGAVLTDAPPDDSAARALAVELRWSLMVINGAPLDDRLPCYVAGSPAWLDHSAPVLERQLGFELRRLDRIPLRMMTPTDQALLPTCAAPLGVALREVAPANTLGLNFRRDEFAYHRGQQEVRRAFGRVAILVGVLLVMTIADLFAAYQFQLSRLTAIDGQIRKVFVNTLPDERPVNEIAQFKSEVDKAEQKLQLLGGIVSLSGAAAIDIARAISAALTDKAKLDIDEYAYDPEAVRIRGRTDSFETVDTIKQQLVAVPYFKDVQVKDVKASADGKDVSFRLILIMTKDTHLGE